MSKELLAVIFKPWHRQAASENGMS